QPCSATTSVPRAYSELVLRARQGSLPSRNCARSPLWPAGFCLRPMGSTLLVPNLAAQHITASLSDLVFWLSHFRIALATDIGDCRSHHPGSVDLNHHLLSWRLSESLLCRSEPRHSRDEFGSTFQC